MAENVDASIEKTCLVFDVTKLFPEQEKALKAFIDRSDCRIPGPLWTAEISCYRGPAVTVE